MSHWSVPHVSFISSWLSESIPTRSLNPGPHKSHTSSTLYYSPHPSRAQWILRASSPRDAHKRILPPQWLWPPFFLFAFEWVCIQRVWLGRGLKRARTERSSCDEGSEQWGGGGTPGGRGCPLWWHLWGSPSVCLHTQASLNLISSGDLYQCF